MTATQTNQQNTSVKSKPVATLHLTGKNPDDPNKLKAAFRANRDQNKGPNKPMIESSIREATATAASNKKKRHKDQKHRQTNQRTEVKTELTDAQREAQRVEAAKKLGEQLGQLDEAQRTEATQSKEEKTTVVVPVADPVVATDPTDPGVTVTLKPATANEPASVHISAPNPHQIQRPFIDERELRLLELRQAKFERISKKRALKKFVPIEVCVNGDTIGGWPIPSTGVKVILRAADGTEFKRVLFVENTRLGVADATGVARIRRRAYFNYRLRTKDGMFGDHEIRVYLDQLGGVSAKLYEELSGAQKKHRSKK